MTSLPDTVVRHLRTLAAVEREAALADDTPPWLVGLMAAVDPVELAELIGDRCPTCGNEPHSVRHDLVREYVQGARQVFACNPDQSGGVRDEFDPADAYEPGDPKRHAFR